MPDVYAQSFGIQPKDKVSLENAITEAIRGWVGHRWPDGEPWFTFSAPDLRQNSAGRFRWEPYKGKSGTILDFTWHHPHASDPRVTWTIKATYLADVSGSTLDLVVSNSGPELGQVGVLLTPRPKLAINLLQFASIVCDGAPLGATPTVLRSLDVPAFVSDVLLDPARQYPVLVLAPLRTGSLSIPANRFHQDFSSLGRQYLLADPASAWALTAELKSRALSVFDGALRCYLPHFGLDSDPKRHPLILPNRLAIAGDRFRFAQWLSVATVARYRRNARTGFVREERAEAYAVSRQQLERDHTIAVAKAAEASDNRALAALYASDTEQLKKERDDLRAEVALLTQKVSALEYALSARSVVAGNLDAPIAEVEELPPSSVAEAVEQSAEMFPDNLVFLDSAMDSANESIFLKPDQVGRALQALAQIAKSAVKGRIGKGLKAALSDHGFTYKQGYGESTPKTIKAQYTFQHKGKKLECDEHIRLGTTYDPEDCLVIHFSSKEIKQGHFIIGHVGKHLRNATTT